MSPGMCVNLYKDGDFRVFSRNQGDARLRGHDKFGAIFAFFQGDARLRGHDNLIKLYRSNNPDYSSEESSST